MSAKDNKSYSFSCFDVIGDTSTVKFPELPKNTPGESPIYPLYYYGDDYQSWIENPHRFMLNDMDDPLEMCFFIRQFPNHGINFSEIDSSRWDLENTWISPSISVVKFNKWTDEMKLYWLRNYQPELHNIYLDPVFKNCRTINVKAGVYEKYVIPFNELLS